jgi:hypothetical protein
MVVITAVTPFSRMSMYGIGAAGTATALPALFMPTADWSRYMLDQHTRPKPPPAPLSAPLHTSLWFTI